MKQQRPRSMERTRGPAAVVALALTTSVSAASVIHVDDAAAAGGDGTSWATAFRFLQDGLDASVPGTTGEIRVAGGLYRPDRSEATPLGSGDRLAAFHLVDGTALRGGYAGQGAGDPDARDLAAHPSVLSGDLLGDDGVGALADNSYHVLVAAAVSSSAILDGFTVTRGHAVAGGGASPQGGGIEIIGGAPLIVDCRFEANAAPGTFGRGGAIFSAGGHPTIVGCTFIDNVASASNDFTAGGGAVYVLANGADFVDCTFVGNQATHGGAIFTAGDTVIDGCTFEMNEATRGGAVHRTSSSGASGALVVRGSSFVNNVCFWYGGAIDFASIDPGPRIERSRFIGNLAGTFDGGAIHGLSAGMRVHGCLLAGNTAGACGGAISILAGTPEISNATIVGNNATTGGGVCAATASGQPSIQNSICWSNTDAGGADETAQIDRASGLAPLAVVNYTLVAGLTGALGGIGNIDADPVFVDADGPDGDPWTYADNDYRLTRGSPAVDAANNWCVPRDTDDADGDGDTQELAPRDLGDEPRFADEPGTPNAGCGESVLVDMGASEVAGTPMNPIIYGDLTGDGGVGFADLTTLLGAWGPCTQAECCLSDLDVSGDTGFTDLNLLLAEWGRSG